jgi:hypothetical protein
MRTVMLSITLLMSGIAGRGADLPAMHQSIDDTARAAALRSWKISLAPLVASQALDVSSSYGMRELNPLLASPNGGFEMKGAVIKLGFTGVAVGAEYLIVRKYPRSARVISKLNWTTGIVTAGFAIHNYAIK